MLAFVPFVPVVPATPSPRAAALGQRLAETIEQFRQQNPDLNGLEVRQATQIAVSRSGGACAPPRMLLALAAGVGVAGLALVLAADKQRAGGGDSWMLMMLIVVLAVVLGVVVALKRRC